LTRDTDCPPKSTMALGTAKSLQCAHGDDIVSIGIVLADDHPLILDALEGLFVDKQGFEVKARCSSGEEALAAVRRFRPEVIILNLHMPGMDGIAVTRIMREEGLPSRVVILTGMLDEREALECLRLGVAGIVLKDMPPSLVFQCVQKVAAGDVWVEKRSFSRAMEHLLRREAGAQRVAGKLSTRELQVVRLCAQGATNAEIAQRLSLTEGTVKSHLHKAYGKLGVRGRADLTRFMHENGLV
jgi:DNA-binding NarL/FixJ family response regulator